MEKERRCQGRPKGDGFSIGGRGGRKKRSDRSFGNTPGSKMLADDANSWRDGRRWRAQRRLRFYSLFSLSKSQEGKTSSRAELSAISPEKHAESAPPLPFTSSRLIPSFESQRSLLRSSLSRIKATLVNTEAGHRRLSRESVYCVGSPRYRCRGL